MYLRMLFFGVIMIKKLSNYFTKTEMILWSVSAVLIILSFILFDRKNYLTLAASLIGVTSLIFNAKGNPFGQLLMIIFSILYGIISYSFAYYGEMITYLGMTGPMALFALISWLRNPYMGKKSEVAVNRLKGNELTFMAVLTAVVTVIFYYILEYFGTANIIPSTVSVTTSFAAVYLTFRRSAYYAIAYAANDIILIILWILASMHDISYISVIICFIVFLVNDLYGFISWRKMSERQQKGY
ncbi:MAG: nicotinamide mononucleotide transporter [Clostridia bacterium]|nr:nicotinamide mononucleotide transporter [Clostridia bacterium]